MMVRVQLSDFANTFLAAWARAPPTRVERHTAVKNIPILDNLYAIIHRRSCPGEQWDRLTTCFLFSNSWPQPTREFQAPNRDLNLPAYSNCELPLPM